MCFLDNNKLVEEKIWATQEAKGAFVDNFTVKQIYFMFYVDRKIKCLLFFGCGHIFHLYN